MQLSYALDEGFLAPTRDLAGTTMRKLNTFSIYQMATLIHPLTAIAEDHRGNASVKLKLVLWQLWQAVRSLHKHSDESLFSPSLKRAAAALIESCHDAGLPRKAGDLLEAFDSDADVQVYSFNSIQQKAKDFEIVLANELPGLSIYAVSQLGIFSTDDLISHADSHIATSLREAVPEKANKDLAESGRCLAFQLPTASAFHMWRALETVMDAYHEALTGESFADKRVTRNWGAYIKALRDAKAEDKVTTFLDHIREEYRNPISHPSDTLESDDAFNLFGTGLSAIGQAAKAIIAIGNSTPPKPGTSGMTPVPALNASDSVETGEI